ncbi:MAG: class I SAM-dependent methyltransferase [Acidobacteriota bacterium]|nr:class I SAM-dependent methyltransferase [Acidobacteriota bacterium]
MDGGTPDPYGRIHYRGLIAWPARLEREGPLLRRVLGDVPLDLLDLGCGTGEHTRFLQAQGHRMTGVDASPSQLRAAREAPPALEGLPPARFVEGDLAALADLVEPGFGGALCLGNTLPHLADGAALDRFLAGLASRLVPGAPVLLQLLNYDRILDRGERTFPVTLRPGEDGAETVFLRLMTPQADGTVIFTPATLRYRPGAEPPLELLAAREVRLRGWRRTELEDALVRAGFAVREALGGMTGEPWSPGSQDLVIEAARG